MSNREFYYTISTSNHQLLEQLFDGLFALVIPPRFYEQYDNLTKQLDNLNDINTKNSNEGNNNNNDTKNLLTQQLNKLINPAIFLDQSDNAKTDFAGSLFLDNDEDHFGNNNDEVVDFFEEYQNYILETTPIITEFITHILQQVQTFSDYDIYYNKLMNKTNTDQFHHSNDNTNNSQKNYAVFGNPAELGISDNTDALLQHLPHNLVLSTANTFNINIIPQQYQTILYTLLLLLFNKYQPATQYTFNSDNIPLVNNNIKYQPYIDLIQFVFEEKKKRQNQAVMVQPPPTANNPLYRQIYSNYINLRNNVILNVNPYLTSPNNTQQPFVINNVLFDSIGMDIIPLLPSIIRHPALLYEIKHSGLLNDICTNNNKITLSDDNDNDNNNNTNTKSQLQIFYDFVIQHWNTLNYNEEDGSRILNLVLNIDNKDVQHQQQEEQQQNTNVIATIDFNHLFQQYQNNSSSIPITGDVVETITSTNCPSNIIEKNDFSNTRFLQHYMKQNTLNSIEHGMSYHSVTSTPPTGTKIHPLYNNISTIFCFTGYQLLQQILTIVPNEGVLSLNVVTHLTHQQFIQQLLTQIFDQTSPFPNTFNLHYQQLIKQYVNYKIAIIRYIQHLIQKYSSTINLIEYHININPPSLLTMLQETDEDNNDSNKEIKQKPIPPIISLSPREYYMLHNITRTGIVSTPTTTPLQDQAQQQQLNIEEQIKVYNKLSYLFENPYYLTNHPFYTLFTNYTAYVSLIIQSLKLMYDVFNKKLCRNWNTNIITSSSQNINNTTTDQGLSQQPPQQKIRCTTCRACKIYHKNYINVSKVVFSFVLLSMIFKQHCIRLYESINITFAREFTKYKESQQSSIIDMQSFDYISALLFKSSTTNTKDQQDNSSGLLFNIQNDDCLLLIDWYIEKCISLFLALPMGGNLTR